MVIPRYLRVNPALRQIRFLLQNFPTAARNPHSRLADLLNSNYVSTVLDVGANVGQFGIDLRRNGYTNRICSFEPIKAIFGDLIKTSRNFQPWDCHNFGLGNENNSQEIHISRNDGLSSSFLPMNESHIQLFPGSNFVEKEVAKVKTLDSVVPNLDINLQESLLKMDVQGFEFKVLQGGQDSIALIPFCFLEVSLVKLYDGESSLIQILNQLSSFHHSVIDIFPGTRTSSGQLIQLDILTSNHSEV